LAEEFQNKIKELAQEVSVPPNDKLDDEHSVDIYYFVRISFRYKYFIGIFTFVVAALSVIYALTAKPLYLSKATMYPVEKGQSGPMLELAMTFGLANKIEAFNIPEVIKSETIARQVILKKYKTLAFKDSVNLIQYWKIDKEEEDKEFAMEYAIRTFENLINVTDEKETFLITIEVRMPERQLSADVANFIAVAVTSQLQGEQRNVIRKTREYLEERLEAAEGKLLDVEEGLIKFKEENYQQTSPALRIEIARHERRFLLMQNFVSMLQKQRELILLDEITEKPVVNLLDRATVTKKAIHPKKREVVITNTFAALVLSLAAVFLKEKYYSKDFFQKLKESMRDAA